MLCVISRQLPEKTYNTSVTCLGRKEERGAGFKNRNALSLILKKKWLKRISGFVFLSRSKNEIVSNHDDFSARSAPKFYIYADMVTQL